MKPTAIALLLLFFLASCSKPGTTPGREDKAPEITVAGKLNLIDSFKTDLPGNWAIASVSGLTAAELDQLKKYDSASKKYYPVLSIGNPKALDAPALGNSRISVGCNSLSFQATASGGNTIAFVYSNVTGINCPSYYKYETMVADALAKARSYTIDNGLKLFDENYQLLITAYALKSSAVE